MSKSILVTGGAGFIASHVATAFLAEGHRVVVLDDLSGGKRENVPEGAELVVADIRSEEARELISNGFDVLCHHAAQMDVRRSVADPRFDADVNIGGLINLLEGGRQGQLKQVIFASTGGAIYGEQDVHPADESHPQRPVSPYGVSKLAGERYLFFYHAQYGLNVTCLRYANVYGPRQNPHGEAGVVAIFAERLLGGREALIFGDGGQTRDYVYVDDVVAANRAAVGVEGFEIFNVGTAVETDVNDLYEQIRRAVGVDQAPVHAPGKPGEQRRSCITAARIRERLGVEIATPIDRGIETTVRWFENRDA